MARRERKRRTNEELTKDILEYLANQDFGVTTQQTARENGLHIRTATKFLNQLLDEGKVFHKKVGRQNQWTLMEYYLPWQKALERRRQSKK